MRIFVALDLDEEIRARIGRFIGEISPHEPNVRWVAASSLHVTLKFIGEKPDAAVRQIETALSEVHECRFGLSFRGCGFFPNPNAPRVFWVGIESEAGLTLLANKVEDLVAEVGVGKEKRAFSPHLTLARAGSGSGAPGLRIGDSKNRKFARLQEKLTQTQAPDFGTMTAREFFLYRSQLSSKGSQYTKIARFPLYSDSQDSRQP